MKALMIIMCYWWNT